MPHKLFSIAVLILLGSSALAAPVPRFAIVAAQSAELEPAAQTTSVVEIGDFPSATPVHFEFERSQWAELRVLDDSGQVVKRIASGWWAPTSHQLAWHGDDDQSQPVEAGTYLIQLWIPEQSELRSAR